MEEYWGTETPSHTDKWSLIPLLRRGADFFDTPSELIACDYLGEQVGDATREIYSAITILEIASFDV